MRSIFEITIRARRRSNADRFIGELHVQRINIGFRINCQGANAQFLAGANNPQGDLAAVGDENFLEHVVDARFGANPAVAPYRVSEFSGL